MTIKLNDQKRNQIKTTSSKSINMSAYPLEKLADIISSRVNNIINSPKTLTNITEYLHSKTKESQEYLEYLIKKENDKRMELATKQVTKTVKNLKSIHAYKSDSEHAYKSDSEFVPSAKKNENKIIR